MAFLGLIVLFFCFFMVIGERFTHEKQRNLYRLNGNVWWEIQRLQRLRSGQTMVKTLNKDHGNHQYIAFVVVCFNININNIYIYLQTRVELDSVNLDIIIHFTRKNNCLSREGWVLCIQPLKPGIWGWVPIGGLAMLICISEPTQYWNLNQISLFICQIPIFVS